MNLQNRSNSLWQRLHIDVPLLMGLLTLLGISLVVLYSASGMHPDIVITSYSIHYTKLYETAWQRRLRRASRIAP